MSKRAARIALVASSPAVINTHSVRGLRTSDGVSRQAERVHLDKGAPGAADARGVAVAVGVATALRRSSPCATTRWRGAVRELRAASQRRRSARNRDSDRAPKPEQPRAWRPAADYCSCDPAAASPARLAQPIRAVGAIAGSAAWIAPAGEPPRLGSLHPSGSAGGRPSGRVRVGSRLRAPFSRLYLGENRTSLLGPTGEAASLIVVVKMWYTRKSLAVKRDVRVVLGAERSTSYGHREGH